MNYKQDNNPDQTNKEDIEKINEQFESIRKNQEKNLLYWKPGKKLKDGKYTIEKFLGTGGFGITYLAKDKGGRNIVIKTIKQYNTDQNYSKDDFYNEACQLYNLQNRYIVQILKIVHEGDVPCIVMEYIQGKTLQEFVTNKGKLSEPEAIQYIRKIGEALKTVHEKHILHRDVKPRNIIIRDNNLEPVLIDFGIARQFSINDEQLALSESWATGYAPIEQYDRDEIQKEFTDVYGLAATLYFCLTGEIPIQSPIRNLGIAKNRDPLVPPNQHNPNISQKTTSAIMKGLEFYGKDRPQSVQEWLDLLPQYSDQKKTIKQPAKLPQNHQNKIDSPVISTPVVEQAKTKENQQPPQNPLNSSENNNDWSLYGRTFLMGAGIWLIVITFLPETAINHKGIWIGIGICLWGIALFFKSHLSLGQKLMQHIFSLIACCLIYLVINNIIPNISDEYFIYLAPIVGILTMIMIAIAELFIVED